METTEKRVGRYILLEPLGRGAMGAVYKAEDPFIRRTVAVKVLHADEALAPRLIRISRERFKREAEAAGRIDHANVIRMYDVGKDETTGDFFLVMEYVPGPSLEKLLEDGLAPERGVEIIGQIAAGLDAAHRRGIIHRDIKPSNILFTEDGVAKIVDFGITRIASTVLTQDMRAVGTPAYMSPEQVHGRDLDTRSDLFSLGVVSYEILSGRKPFEGTNAVAAAYAITHAEPRPISQAKAGLPVTLDAPFARILSKEPSARFATGQEFIEAVRRCLPEMLAPHAAAPNATGRSRRRLLLQLGGMAALAAAIVLVLFLGKQATGDSAKPKPTPTAVPKAAPKPAPTAAPKPAPTAAPKVEPTAASKVEPAAPPRVAPTVVPKTAPTAASQPATVPMADVTITLAHRVSRGTLVVSLDGAPILDERFSKPKMVLFQTTTWDTLQAPSGAHKLTARVIGENGKTYLSDSLAVEMARTGNNLVRIGFKRDKLTVVNNHVSR